MGTVEVVPQPTKSKTSGSKTKLFYEFHRFYCSYLVLMIRFFISVVRHRPRDAVVGELVLCQLFDSLPESFSTLYDVHSFDVAHLHEAHTNLLIVP